MKTPKLQMGSELDRNGDERPALGFLHEGTFVTDPNLSECGRFEVDPATTYGLTQKQIEYMRRSRATNDAQRSIPRFRELTEMTVRYGIEALLEECTAEQVESFRLLHADAPWRVLADCPVDRLGETYDLLRRTVIHNRTMK